MIIHCIIVEVIQSNKDQKIINNNKVKTVKTKRVKKVDNKPIALPRCSKSDIKNGNIQLKLIL